MTSELQSARMYMGHSESSEAFGGWIMSILGIFRVQHHVWCKHCKAWVQPNTKKKSGEKIRSSLQKTCHFACAFWRKEIRSYDDEPKKNRNCLETAVSVSQGGWVRYQISISPGVWLDWTTYFLKYFLFRSQWKGLCWLLQWVIFPNGHNQKATVNLWQLQNFIELHCLLLIGTIWTLIGTIQA